MDQPVSAAHEHGEGGPVANVSVDPVDPSAESPAVGTLAGECRDLASLPKEPGDHEPPHDTARAGDRDPHVPRTSIRSGSGRPSWTRSQRSISGPSRSRLGWSACHGFSYW